MIIGLIGKPSAGKSSFFKAATMIDVKISDVPFTTIQPNMGVGYVAVDCVCKEFGVKCNPKTGYCKNHKRYVPVKLVDVGGLIPGSHLGKGIGNKFLDDLRQASVLIQIVDTSGLTDSEGKPTTNYDPETEIKFLEDEIDLWFSEVVDRAITKFKAQIAKSTKADLIQILAEQLSGLEITKGQIMQSMDEASLSDVKKFAAELRKISKPIVYAANKIDLKEAQENFEKLKLKYSNLFPTSAEAEIALKKAAEKNLVEYEVGNGFTILDPYKLSESQLRVLEKIQKEVIEKFGSTGIQLCLNKAVFDFLNYIAVYPVEDENKLTDKEGNILPDVHLLLKNSTALDLAFKVHTDLGKKFVSAVDARTKKRLGKDYQLQNGDVIKIIVAK